MVNTFLRKAAVGESVYITDVREAFQARGTRPFHIHVTLYDRAVRVFPLTLPETSGEAEAGFVAEYVHACIYNILSALGALGVDIYLDRRDSGSLELAEGLDRVFQTDRPKEERSGYGACLNVNERVMSALFPERRRFVFRILDVKDEPRISEPSGISQEQTIFAQLPGRTAGKKLLGMDVGGTDVKLVVSVDGQLSRCWEFDWNPASFTRAEELTGPLLKAAEENGPFDAIGLCFPDVVIQNRIVGGETPKTQGMRRNSQLDYEEQFAKITALTHALMEFVVPGGKVRCVNDGPMASFTAAVERGAAGEDLSKGFFAHTLGTDLGTGWVRPNGSIPDIPLEVYSFIIDLGSYPQRKFDPEDIRSVYSSNSLLPGALQKYGGQSGVFRLAAWNLPQKAPAVFQEAIDRGLLRWEGERLVVPTRPTDTRKEALEFFMEKAAQPGQEACQDIFREMGEYQAVVWRETNFILRPEAEDRGLFGRLVKRPACFRLIQEGAVRREPGLRLLAADSSLANTPLMKQLDAHPDYAVAQFAQAVGAVYYACLE